MKKVTVYTGPSCPYCTQAKALLKRKNIPFEEIAVSWEDAAGWEAMMKRSNGMKTVPQIYVGEQLVGGYTDLAALDSRGELDRLLAE